jgi:ATP-dependent Lhr-like helicase
VSHFDQLHPAVQHHIVNSLGWRSLRPFQDAVIPGVMAGTHLIILAPTAGGKTEAAFFPVLSRMLIESWSGLSVLYLCPIKALLNNLDARLERYCTLIGRRSTLWHGDVKQAARRRILREPPDCLLTTPESLEVMLVSPNVDPRALFASLRVVIVDEIHAFAGDDRGWHLLSVIERISRLAGREPQRIGLSATVGNPKDLLDWLIGSSAGDREILLPDEASGDHTDVKIDYVGSLSNAAVVVSRLHRGEKRLVFIDSRSRAEQLGSQLRQLGATAFVTHSSLSPEQRRQAEDAFANRDDCVIVATSVLELGIDVGDLDRVIQIDSPPTVSSFLQRMGRTGRRTGAVRNCLFLATKDEALLQAMGLIELWQSGFIEPITPPPVPFHILAHQLMALALQEKGIGRSDWFEWIRGVAGFQAISDEQRSQVVDWMLQREILWDDSGILWFGQKGEAAYGRKNFLELMSVFLSPPLFTVLHGREELGFVDQMTFLGKEEHSRVLLLGGRAWRVTHIDWQRRRAHVVATEDRGRSRWKGEGLGLHCRLSQAIRNVLASEEMSPRWSERAREQIDAIRTDYPWIERDETAVVRDKDGVTKWWTFAGFRANATIARKLSELTGSQIRVENFGVTFESDVPFDVIEQAIQELSNCDLATLRPMIDEKAIEGFKFSACLPPRLAIEMLERRMADNDGAKLVVAQGKKLVT